MQIIEKINLIDIFFLIVGLRIIYIAASGGIIKEIFKITGSLGGAFLAFHYYSPFASMIGEKIPFLNEQYIGFLPFFFIFSVLVIFFSFLGKLINLFLKREELSLEEKSVALFAGIFRFIFFTSVVIFGLSLLPVDKKYYQGSFSYRMFKNVAPGIYLGTVEFYSKFNQKAVVNEEVKKYYEVKESLSGSSAKRH